MRPNEFHKLDVMPYNANGKIDRKALKGWKIITIFTVLKSYLKMLMYSKYTPLFA